MKPMLPENKMRRAAQSCGAEDAGRLLPAGREPGGRLAIAAEDFNEAECVQYLCRNANELLHRVDEGENGWTITKAFRLEREPVLFRLHREGERLIATFPRGTFDAKTEAATAGYIREWLDLDRNLDPFYRMAETDPILRGVVPKYKGLRIVGVPDLFEALAWAIMGQQISLHVAYLLKKRLVESFGEPVPWDGRTYWLFPAAETIAALRVEDLLALKFSRGKAEYLIGTAGLIRDGKLSKDELLAAPDIADMESRLTSIRGIGRWTANYAIMRCLRHPEAFPAADAGLHNALKRIAGLDGKPSAAQLEEWSRAWSGWQAYAVFYLWRTLTD